jgi:hypothetical protein
VANTRTHFEVGAIGFIDWLGLEATLLLAFSRLPVDCVLCEVGVHGAAYGRIEVCYAEAIE